jgi:hypothetical protein
MRAVIAEWGAEASVAIVHMLPPHLWIRTELGEPSVLASAVAPGAVLAEMRVERLWWAPRAEGIAAPMIPLDAESIMTWALAQMARGRQTPAVVVGSDGSGRELPAEPAARDIAAAVEAFRSTATPEAYELAVYLCSSAFTLPVARLIQAAKFHGAARQSHLAEVLMSGLLHRRNPDTQDPNRIYFEFLPEAAAVLRRSLRTGDADELAATLERHVTEYLLANRGQAINFRALVRSENGQFDLPAFAQPFAEMGTALLGTPGAARAVDKFEEFIAARTGKILQAAQLFARSVLRGGRKLGPAWAADASNIVECDVPLWAVLLEHGMVLEPEPGRYELLPGLLERFDAVGPSAEHKFHFTPFVFVADGSGAPERVIDISHLPFRREHLIRSADYLTGTQPQSTDETVARRYAIPFVKDYPWAPDRTDPAILHGVPSPGDFAEPYYPSALARTSLTAIFSSRDFDARSLLIDYVWANRREFREVHWGSGIPTGQNRNDLTIVDGTPDLPLLPHAGDLILLDPHPDVIFMYQDIVVFDGNAVANQGPAPNYGDRQGLRCVFDFAMQAGIEWPEALDILQRQPSGRPGTDLATLLRTVIPQFSKEELSTLQILAAIGTGPIPKVVLEQLPSEVMQRFADLLITRLSSQGLHFSEIGLHAFLLTNIGHTPRPVLDLYVNKFGKVSWWRMPGDGFLHQNLMRLLDPDERRGVLSDPRWWRLRIDHGGSDLANDLGSVDISLPDEPNYRAASGLELAQMIVDSFHGQGPVMQALREGAGMFLQRLLWRGAAPRLMVIAGPTHSKWRPLAEDAGFELTQRPENPAQLQAAVSSARALLTAAEPDNDLLRACIEANVPLISIPFLEAGVGKEKLEAVVIAQLQELRTDPEPPRWTSDVLAYYAGRGRNASLPDRISLLASFLLTIHDGGPYPYPGTALDVAYTLLDSYGVPARRTALNAIDTLLSHPGLRTQLLQSRQRLEPIEVTSDQSARVAFRVTAFNLAQDYNYTLAKEGPGRHRTSVIASISRVIRERVDRGTASDYREYLRAPDPGHRLWGYLGLAQKGGPGDIAPILRQVGMEQEPSAQLAGLQSVEILCRPLKELSIEVRDRLIALSRRLPPKGDRSTIVRRILTTGEAKPTQPTRKNPKPKRMLK